MAPCTPTTRLSCFLSPRIATTPRRFEWSWCPAEHRKRLALWVIYRAKIAFAYRPVIDRLVAVGRLAACAVSLTGGWDR